MNSFKYGTPARNVAARYMKWNKLREGKRRKKKKEEKETKRETIPPWVWWMKVSVLHLKRDRDEQITCREMNCQAGEPKRGGCSCTENKEEKRSEVRKNARRLGVLGEIRDPSQVFEIALGWAGDGVCKEEGRKRGLEIHRPPLVLQQRRFQNKLCLRYPGISWTRGPHAILRATAPFPEEKGQVRFQS